MASVDLRDQYQAAMTVLEGTFRGRCVEATVAQSQNGNDQIKYKLQIEGGPHHGRTFPDNATITPAAMRMFFEKMAGFGLGEAYFMTPAGQPVPSLEQTARDIIGRPCEFILAKDEYRGVTREKVQKIIRVADVAPVTRSVGGVAPMGGPLPSGGVPGPVPAPAPAPGAAPAPAPAVVKPPVPAGDKTAPPEPPF